jgi:hypothetical protein
LRPLASEFFANGYALNFGKLSVLSLPLAQRLGFIPAKVASSQQGVNGVREFGNQGLRLGFRCKRGKRLNPKGSLPLPYPKNARRVFPIDLRDFHG